MKFTEEKLEKAFAGWLGQEVIPQLLGFTIAQNPVYSK
jgi:hypothetical protein